MYGPKQKEQRVPTLVLLLSFLPDEDTDGKECSRAWFPQCEELWVWNGGMRLVIEGGGGSGASASLSVSKFQGQMEGRGRMGANLGGELRARGPRWLALSVGRQVRLVAPWEEESSSEMEEKVRLVLLHMVVVGVKHMVIRTVGGSGEVFERLVGWLVVGNCYWLMKACWTLSILEVLLVSVCLLSMFLLMLMTANKFELG